MAKRDRLGKGLGALIAEYVGDDDVEESAIRKVPLGSIEPNPFQPRRDFDEEELSELATSIRENGLLQPIVVRSAPPSSTASWQLVAGERRWRAITRLGWSEVPAVVREVDDRTLLVLALVENLQRSALTALDEAEAYEQLQQEFGLSQQEIAEAVGRNRSTVANTLRLLQLPATVRRLLAEGELTAGHARALLAMPNERALIEAAQRAVEQGWSVRDMESFAGTKKRRARAAAGDAQPKGDSRGGRPRRDASERRLEEELQRLFGTAVRIRRSRRNKGRIEIPFYSLEDFERIFEELTGVSATDVVS